MTPPARFGTLLALFVSLLGAMAASAPAQDSPPVRCPGCRAAGFGDSGLSPAEDAPPPDPPPSRDFFHGHWTLAQGALEGGEFVLSMVEGVSLDRGSLSVESRNMVLWMDPDRVKEEGGPMAAYVPSAGSRSGPVETPPSAGGPPTPGLAGSRDVPADMRDVLGPVLHALYAEGDVLFRLGTRTLRTDRLFVDFRRNLLTTGRVVLSTNLTVMQKARTLPLILRGVRMRRTSVNTLLLEEASYTTCDFEDPHYEFRCREFLLTDEEDHSTLTGYRNVLEVEDIPVFYLPWLSMRSDASSRPLRSVNVQSSSRFGQELNLLWGDDILHRGGIWGEWRLRTDGRTARGPGIGPELQYDHGDMAGELLVYLQQDRAEKDDFDDSPVPREDRGRVRWEHRQKFSPGLRLDFSYSDFSDRNFQPEFLKKEFLEERDPESYAYLRWARRTDLASLSVKGRPDGFRTETTELPEAAFHRVGASFPGAGGLAPFLDDLTYSADVRTGAYERAYDEALGVEGNREMREDAVLRLEGSRWAGPVSLAPFVVVGATMYQGLDLPGETGRRERFDLAGGLRATLEARRTFPDASSGLFGFHGLRHLVELQALAYHRAAVSQAPLGVSAVDRTDTLEEARVLEVRLRNRLQAWRGSRRVDWIDLELRGVRFPGGLRGRADPLRFKEEGLDGPRFQDFTGEDKMRASPLRGEWGPFEGDLRVWLRENLFLIGDAEYDPYAGEVRTAAAGVRWFSEEDFSLYGGNRRIAGDSNIFTFSQDWAFSDRWVVRLAQQVDFLNAGRLGTDVGIRRVWHDVVLEINVKKDLTTGDSSFSLTLVPSFLWTAPTSAERLARLDYEAQKWYR